MELTTREDGDITILTVNGDLVIGERRDHLQEDRSPGCWKRAASTFSWISPTSASSTAPGLGALVRALTQSQKEGGQTKLLNAGPQVRKLLQMTKLDSVFEIHSDLEAAVSSF